MIDPNRIAVAGHSDGAAVAFGVGYQPFRLDARVRSVVSYAADLGYFGLYQPNGRPILHVLSDQDEYNPYGEAIGWTRSTLQQPKFTLLAVERDARTAVHEPGRPALRSGGPRHDRVPRHHAEGAPGGDVLRQPVRRRELGARRARVTVSCSSSSRRRR